VPCPSRAVGFAPFPRDSGLVPSGLPDGVKEIVIVDDTPDVTADLAVHPVGGDYCAFLP
jgi:hypothetical protein